MRASVQKTTDVFIQYKVVSFSKLAFSLKDELSSLLTPIVLNISIIRPTARSL